MSELNQTAANKVTKARTTDIVMTGMFTAVICVMAQIVIPIQPIPFSLALFAIFLTGALLTPRYAFLAVFVYLLLGTCGVPVFAGLQGGLAHLTGPTGGFLAAFPIMAFVTALIPKYIKKYRLLALSIGMLSALFLCYLIGTLWFCFISGNSFYSALFTCVVPFVFFDVIKAVLAIAVSTVIRKTIMRNTAI